MNINRPINLPFLRDINDSNPYFFQNSNVSPHIYIAQSAKSEATALHTVDVWNNHRYNIGETTVEDNGNMSYNRVLYDGNNEISIVPVNGGNKNNLILVYKYNNKINYVALLLYKVI